MIGALVFAAAAAPVQLPAAAELRRLAAEEARQGVAADSRFVYAISNSVIGKYDRRTGERVARWQGDPELFVHVNSCTLAGPRLVCAASNYPDVPMASSVEWFDAARLEHVASRSLGPGRGSLTWLEWHDGSWWACFANYNARGGEPGRDHRWTSLVRYDRNFAEQGAWLFPDSVLERFAPYSSSGGSWKGRHLYVTGHDRAEVYVLKLPEAGSRLIHVATFAFPSPGQAIQWDRTGATLWSIDRRRREVVESRPPEIQAEARPAAPR